MGHRHGAAFVCGEKSRVERDVADVSPGNAETSEPGDVEILRRRLGRKYAPPNFGAMRRIGKGKLDHETKPPQKRVVDGRFQISRKNRETAVGLHSLKQVTDFYVGVTVVTVFDFASFSEERIRFVEEQHGAAIVGRVRHATQVLFSFTDVLADDPAQVNAIESRRNSFAKTSAAIVLPVPLEPAKAH